MSLRESLEESHNFSFRNNIFYQRDIPGSGLFEQQYTDLRRKEDRLYSDAVVRTLPKISANHPLNREWQVRASSSRKLLRYLRKKPPGKILEVGCGNGWLCGHLATLPGSEVAGIDVNGPELLQAARVFSDLENVIFCQADIFRALPVDPVDCIVLAASIQYFPDISAVIKRLLTLLAQRGEIHIVDSPFYEESQIPAAQHRSRKHFQDHGFPLMNHHYHHHLWKDVEAFNCKILYDPRHLPNRLTQKFAFASPFPWLRITL